jgi:hypothetical protein
MVVMKSCVFWSITPCSPLKVNWQAELWLLPAPSWFLAWFILRPWTWRRYVPPKIQLALTGLHGVISQKSEVIQIGRFL